MQAAFGRSSSKSTHRSQASQLPCRIHGPGAETSQGAIQAGFGQDPVAAPWRSLPDGATNEREQAQRPGLEAQSRWLWYLGLKQLADAQERGKGTGGRGEQATEYPGKLRREEQAGRVTGRPELRREGPRAGELKDARQTVGAPMVVGVLFGWRDEASLCHQRSVDPTVR
ncbi:hypothetical protein N658DRAFT_533939 [Parathielavia hyrcaniae]|uniref:Uncharacterized protein n=1 Tax=Parathielavia hyrcaniae TaxID=113614 RepID=A0AAN6Q505_9PEZI|nr:hypothetical protein N658DRAFT_533939 [Parathielavia hyrcaniae]